MTAVGSTVDLTEVKSRHLLGDVVEGAGIQLRGRGRVRQGICPFHDEAEGSFTVYADTQRFHCFGCGATGDVLDFVQHTEGVSLPEALRRLGGAGPAVARAGPAPRSRDSGSAVLPPRDTALLTAAVRFYAGQLRRSPTATGVPGLAGHPARNRQGVGPGLRPGGTGFRSTWRASGSRATGSRTPGSSPRTGRSGLPGWWSSPKLREAGCAGSRAGPLTRPARQGSSPCPAPSRCWDWGDWGSAPRWLVLTEGLFDWLALTQWGLPACAALGTQGMERVTPALPSHCRVLLAFDSDDAGRAASQRLNDLLGRRGCHRHPARW